MPLGQQPYGTRSPETPPQPPAPGPRRIGSRWLFFVLAAGLAVALVVQLRSGGEKKAVTDSTECLTDRGCGAGWRCFAVPKDDGFAVTGVCSHACNAEGDCAAPLNCTEVAVGDNQVVPVGARGGSGQHVKVCRPR